MNRILLLLAAAVGGAALIEVFWPTPSYRERDDAAEVVTTVSNEANGSATNPATRLAQPLPPEVREQRIIERLRMQNPELMLPDVGSAELQRVHHMPWGATDPDAFWHSQMLKVKDATMEHVPLRLKQ
ncbi:hypothetical protein [Brevifollis gellanilyticus]|nr:hypothetical protein [Brevifollis gellanilyticus]